MPSLTRPTRTESKSIVLSIGVGSTVKRAHDHVWRDLLVTVVAVTVASGLRVLLAPVLYDRASFLLFTLAVMISALVGGWRMGGLATVLAGIAGIWLFVRPFYEANVHDLQDAAQTLLFAATGCGISFLAGQLQAARIAAEEEARNTARLSSALSELIESITEGFLAFDSQFRLIFMNRSAEEALSESEADLVGSTVWELFPAVIGDDVEQLLRRVMSDRTPGTCEAYYRAWDCWLAINVYPFRSGISVLLRDISERKQTQREREKLIRELREAIAGARTMRGLLPICASCKKIRDDKGYWEQLEVYIRDHSEANFSHGLCPDCAHKYWGA